MGLTEREAVYAISRMNTIGPAAYERLLGWYGSAGAAWRETLVPLPEKQQEEWKRFHRPERESALRKELQQLPSRGIRFLEREEADFPEQLRCIPSPPIGLFLKGRLPGPGEDLVAMIGARRCTEYGKENALAIAQALAREGIGVVSGMAMGIDSYSQWGALQGGGYSLAVLGSGIDMCYPPSNRRLYERLAEEGGILSEYGPGEKGLPFHFPLRNRLISGMAGALLVLEAREKSGTLITVDWALEQGKEVLALPGRIADPLSQGCNQLIRQGAGIYTGLSDLLAALGRRDEEAEKQERKQADPLLGLPDRERAVYEQIQAAAVHQDEIASGAGVPLTELFGILWDLECRGLIRNCSPGMYIRKQ